MPKVGHGKSPLVAAIPHACIDEEYATEFLEGLIWDSGYACPRCGDTDVYAMKSRENGRQRQQNGRWRCRGCKRQYTVRTGTIMEDSRIPLRHWCYAFWRACSSKKGVSALQISRETGISYKSALFLMHRVRYAMSDWPGGEPLRGTVEVDETYVGGKPRYQGKQYRRVFADQPYPVKPFKGKKPDFAERKTPVLAMVERGGRVKALPPAHVSGRNLKAAMRAHIDRSATIMTDEHRGYQGIGAHFQGGHKTVNHSRREYARGNVSTNTVEGFFSLLKRGLIGTFHHVSRTHLGKYVAEFEFRYNHRANDDGDRTVAAIKAGRGKRLTYARHLTGA